MATTTKAERRTFAGRQVIAEHTSAAYASVNYAVRLLDLDNPDFCAGYRTWLIAARDALDAAANEMQLAELDHGRRAEKQNRPRNHLKNVPVRTCPVCGKEFQTRSDVQTCGKPCRVSDM